MRRIVICALLGVLATVPAFGAGSAQWITTWAAAPLAPTPPGGPFPASPSFKDQTIRQIVHLSAGGTRLRLRISNEYGTKPLMVGAATVAIAAADGSVDFKTQRTVTFGGQPGARIARGAPLVSDPIDLPAQALSNISVSLYFPEDTGPCTCHQAAMQEGYVSESGNFTASAFTPASKIQSRAFLSAVEVETRGGRTVVVLGDSISDGIGSTPNMNRRWPDLLAVRLAKERTAWGVANLGISGNRILEDGAGQSALARFDRDVLSLAGVTHLIIFEGVNDLGVSYGRFEGAAARFRPPETSAKATADSMIAAYRQLIARAHAHGIKVLGATIAPYGGAMYYSPEGETQRQAINQWIRTGQEFDGVLDFDAAFRDPADPTKMAEGKHMGDHLHGSDAGYEAVAQSIDLKLFK
jgi:lysophospholipase L1-like esterase